MTPYSWGELLGKFFRNFPSIVWFCIKWGSAAFAVFLAGAFLIEHPEAGLAGWAIFATGLLWNCYQYLKAIHETQQKILNITRRQ